jgi:hypothetical protein
VQIMPLQTLLLGSCVGKGVPPNVQNSEICCKVLLNWFLFSDRISVTRPRNNFTSKYGVPPVPLLAIESWGPSVI